MKALRCIYIISVIKRLNTCFVKYVYKVGIPVKSIDKYLKALREKEYSYIVCRFTSDGIKVLYRNDKILENLGCKDCQNAIIKKNYKKWKN